MSASAAAGPRGTAAASAAIPGFDAKTGGVRAEALIKFAAYDDVASCLAGNPLDLSNVSARLAALKLSKRGDGATSSESGGGGGRGRGAAAPPPSSKADLTAVAAAAELVELSMGIPPVQGLPVAAPRPPLPESWRRLAVYAAATLAPAAVLHEALFERSFWWQLQRAGALAEGGAAGGGATYPLFLASAATSVGAQPFAACLASAQALALLSITLWLVATSAFFLHRTRFWRDISPLRSHAWLAGAALALALQLAYSLALAPAFLQEQPWDGACAKRMRARKEVAEARAEDRRANPRARALPPAQCGSSSLRGSASCSSSTTSSSACRRAPS